MQGAIDFLVSQNALSVTAEVVSAGKAGKRRVRVRNMDTTIVVYVGGSDVDASHGWTLLGTTAASTSQRDWVELYVQGDVWAVAASGTPTVQIIEEWD